MATADISRKIRRHGTGAVRRCDGLRSSNSSRRRLEPLYKRQTSEMPMPFIR